MKRLRYRLTCIITLVVVTVGSIFNPVFSLRVQATEVVVGGELIDYLVAFIISVGATYMGYELVEGLDSNTVTRELTAYCNTTEGSSALNKYAGFKVIDGGGGSDPEPPEDPEDPKDPNEILDTKLAGLELSKELFDFVSGFLDYSSKSEDSVIGAAINEASSQQVTYMPFPKNFHFSSLDDPVYNSESFDLIMAQYPGFSVPGNSFIQIYTPFSYDTFMICPATDNFYVEFRIDKSTLWYGTYNVDGGVFSGFNYIRNLQTDAVNRYIRSSSYTSYSDDSDVYLCGNVRFSWRNASYILNPDGSIYEVVEGQPDQLVIPHITTAEGYLTSVRPIVDMDITALVDAIGKAIADSYPDVAPVLTQEAIDYITNNVSNVYDNAVTNYYNDTSYIDQSQYITNITNVYEQAIADNPVIDLPVADTGVLSAIKAIPAQIADTLEDIFLPDISLFNFYFLDIKSKFAFADDIFDLGSNIITILFNSDPEIPKIVIDFGLAESKYNYGGRTYALDMTFYARFKPLVDNIIVSFSWLAFVYWIYKNLPEIISGSILSRKDYAVVKETGRAISSGNGTLSKDRVREIRDIDKIDRKK